MTSRRLALSLSLLVSVAGCESLAGPGLVFPPVQDVGDVALPDSLRAAYSADAAVLAARYVHEQGVGIDEVRLPAPLVTALYNAIVRVYAVAHPARDSVFEIYRIRAFPRPATRELIVALEDDAAWASAWRNGQPLTGNAAVDALMKEYGLAVRTYYEWTMYDAAVLRSAEPLNIAALAKRFAPIGGVRHAEPNGVVGDSDDIVATAVDGGWRLDFTVKWGDCPAGCIHGRTWSFGVESGGRVSYLGASGDSAPEPGRR